MKRHKWYDVIVAYAEGAEIQWRKSPQDNWFDIPEPSFVGSCEYRVKPREFPKSSLSYGVLCDIVNAARKVRSSEGFETIMLRMCADAAVKQHILDLEREAANGF